MRLEIAGLTVAYGAIEALSDVDLTAPAGNVTAIVGANGAGKSTLLKAVVGLVQIKRGAIAIDGEDVTALTPERRHARGIVLSPEGRRLFPELTVYENLMTGAIRRRDAGIKHDLELIYAMFPRLHERRDNLGRHLSGGEQQMCAIGRAMLSRPRLLLFDEPSLGLAPKVLAEVAAAVRRIAATGVTVVLVEQNTHVALSLASTAYLLEAGRVALSGRANDLSADPRLHDIYFGTHES